MAAGMDFKAAREKVRGALAPKRPKDLSRSALTDDKLRDDIIGEAEQRSERFQGSINKHPELEYTNPDTGETESFTWESFPEAMRDYARAAFQWDEPQVKRREDIQPSHRLNREVIQAMLNSESFEESRPYTRNSELESLFGAMAAGESLRESAQGVLAEHVKLSNDIEQAESGQQDAEEMFENLRQRARQEIADTGEVPQGTRREIKQALKQIAAAQQQVGQLMGQQLTGSMIVDAIAAGEAAAEAGADAASALSMLPGSEPGNPQNLSLDRQVELAQKWLQNDDLRAILKMLGRMLRSFRFKRSARVKNVKVEPVGVTTGNDLGLLLPHEAARGFSDNPLVKTTFMKDYAERSLLQYDMSGKAPSGKGPIIAAWDGSGSMSGEPFQWASSVALTLQMTASREKRAFVGIEFGSSHEMKSWYFPKGEPPDADRVLDMTTHFYGGGTDITVGMREALRILKDEPAFKLADIILISDGHDSFAADDLQIRNELREMGVRVHGISIMCPGNSYLGQACDYVVDVMDLANNDAIDKLSENIH